MRAFLIACLVAVIIALAAAIALNKLIEADSSNAFSTPSVRL
jgi:hypothetical protein